MHTHRDNQHYTVMFSNTARAHEQNTTDDWTAIYRDDNHSHGRWTVITSQFGRLKGHRIVRGREDECRCYYRLGEAVVTRDSAHPPHAEHADRWDDDAGRCGVCG
ncbi:hypothetical protein [Rubripirellula tenax]|uniref:hypothetical protein n=1 Tax=Rubripirellula tenax TaxID=2528015 RepID=UPI001FEC4CA0|nr:hypothetical protein [Rubripirellula tenax]